MHRKREKVAPLSSIRVHGQEVVSPNSTSRELIQEVERRIDALLSAAESADTQKVPRPPNSQRTNDHQLTSPLSHRLVAAAPAASKGTPASPRLPSIHAPRDKTMDDDDDSIVCRIAPTTAYHVDANGQPLPQPRKPDGTLQSPHSLQVQVSGNALAVLRHCIRHFLSHEDAYGKNVRLILEDELRFVLGVWATSDTSRSQDSDQSSRGGLLVGNIIQDNFFERMLKLEQAKWAKSTHGELTRSRALLGEEAGEGWASGTPVPSSALVVSSPSRMLSPPLDGGGFEVATLRRQVKTLTQLNAILQEQLNAKTMEYNEAIASAEELQENEEELEKQVLEGRRQQGLLEDQLKQLKSSVEEQLLKVNNFRDEEEEKRRVTEARLRETKGELGQVYAQWKTAQSHMAASQKELDRSVEETERLRTALETATHRLERAKRVVARRNQSLTLMQELLNRRRDSHEHLQQCVRELEAFAGSGTLTEMYLASDPAWSLFLFYRLHRQVFHITANVGVPSLVMLSQLHQDVPLFVGTTEGGSWCVSGFSTEHLYRLVHSNNGESLSSLSVGTPSVPSDSLSPGKASAVPNSKDATSTTSRFLSSDGCGACTTLAWSTSPYFVTFTSMLGGSSVGASTTVTPRKGSDSNPSSPTRRTQVKAAAQTQAVAPKTVKCCPIVCIESLLFPMTPSVAKRLNVPANRAIAAHAAAVNDGDGALAETLSKSLPPPYTPVPETVDDTMKFRRSDIRVILYALWKERFQEHVRFFDAARTAAIADATNRNRGSFRQSKDPASPPPEFPKPLDTFLSFVYRFLNSKFPNAALMNVTNSTGARRRSTAATEKGTGAAAASTSVSDAVACGHLMQNTQYFQALDPETTSLRCAIGEDRVGYCFVRARVASTLGDSTGGHSVADDGVGLDVTQPSDNSALNAFAKQTKTSDSLISLSAAAKEVLMALLHYSMEYKEVDSDLRLFYLVAHQMLPESVAINFLSMIEAIYRDCDEAVLGLAAMKGNSSAMLTRKSAQGQQAQDIFGPMGRGGAQGPLRELYRPLAVTSVEMKSIPNPQNPVTFDEPSSDEDDERSITQDVGGQQMASYTFLSGKHHGRGSLTSTLASPASGLDSSLASVPQLARLTSPTHVVSPTGVPTNTGNSTTFQNQLRTSEAIHRNGLISLHEFVGVLERHCFASYYMVRATAAVYDWVGVATSVGDEHRHFRASFMTPRKSRDATQAGEDHSSDDGSSSSDVDESGGLTFDKAFSSTDNGDVLMDPEALKIARQYRRKLRSYQKRQHQGNDQSFSNGGALRAYRALDRVGYVPLTPIQAQRLKFALSLDQPSSVVKYAALFRPEAGSARPSHFYDELLSMVIDHHLAVQEVIMEELVLPSCRCRLMSTKELQRRQKHEKRRASIAQGKPISSESSSSESSSEEEAVDGGQTPHSPLKKRRSTAMNVCAPREECDGSISIEQMVLHAARWISSLHRAQMAQQAVATVSSDTPGATRQPTPNTADSGGSDSSRGHSASATASAPHAEQSRHVPHQQSSTASPMSLPPYSLEIAAKRLVLQLAESCPKDNVSSQFHSTVVRVTVSNDALLQMQDQHQAVCNALNTYTTLPLHFLAAKLRTTFVVFDVQNAPATQEAIVVNQPIPLSSRRSTAVGAAISKSSFVPADREMLATFRSVMESSCDEAEQRMTLQRALFNRFPCVLPLKADVADATPGPTNAAKKLVSASKAAVAALGRSARLAAGDGTSPRKSFGPSFLGDAGSASPTLPSFQSLYRDVDDVSAGGTQKEIASGFGASVMAKTTRRSTAAASAISSRRKSVGEAINQMFDAARLASSAMTLSQVQDSTSIPLELSLATLLKRQLAPKFPAQLIPTLAELHVYHKALMTALLKPIDDITVAQVAETVRKRSLGEGAGTAASLKRVTSFGPRSNPRGVSFRGPRDDGPPTSPKGKDADGKQGVGFTTNNPSSPLLKTKSELSRAASFALKRIEPLNVETIDAALATPTTTAGTGTGTGAALPAARRRLGSIAMGMYSNLM